MLVPVRDELKPNKKHSVVACVVATAALSAGGPPHKLVCALERHQCH